MKLLRLLFSLTAFSASLFFGCQAAKDISASNGAKDAILAATLLDPAPAAIEFPNGQRSILIVLADSLETLDPQLEGIWLALIVPPDTRLTLLPIYPAPVPNPDKSAQLAGAFHLDGVEGKPQASVEFLQILRDDEIWWSDLLLIDRTSMGSILEYLNSRSVSPVPGSAAPSAAVLLEDFSLGLTDPGKALQSQAGVFQEMCWDAAHFDFRTTLTGLLDSLNGHLISSARPEETVAGLNGIDFSTGSLVCEFPTLAPQALR